MNRNCIQEVAPHNGQTTGRLLLFSQDDCVGRRGCAYLLRGLNPSVRLALTDGEKPAASQEIGCPQRREGKRRHRILIIEDDPASLQLYSYLLRAFGYQTLAAADGVDGLAAARREQPDLIICDVQLPGLGGVDLMRELKADPFLRRIPIIAITAYAMVGDRERLLQAGFNGYIPKPIVPETFVEQINSYLDQVETSVH